MRTLLAICGISAVALSSPAHAVVCTGTTQTVGSGGSVAATFLLGSGNCVEAGDKIFGEFAASGSITGDGSSSYTFFNTPGNVTLGFSGVVGPSTVGTIAYSVAVDPALSQGFLIDALQKDITLNASVTGDPASATLTGGITAPFVVAFDCNRTVNPSGGSCPETHFFAPVSQINVSEMITTGPNTIVTALTDTIAQVPPSVPEPASLVLLGTAILGFGVGQRWMRRRRDDTGCRAVT